MLVVEWIRRESAAGRPLNLHAVALRCPSILKKAFSSRSPRGWQASLYEAGINPYRIQTEHQEHVVCLICGHTAGVLGAHLKHEHSIDGSEYSQEFGPEAELSSEVYRASRFKARPIHGVKHWEQLWSRHYVMDWILRLNEEGHAVNFHALNLAGGQSLTGAGIKFFGSWDQALQAADLNPDVERAIPPFQQWDADKVIQALREHAEAKEGDWRLRLPHELRHAALRVFGALEKARKAAGLHPEAISSRAVFHGPKARRLVQTIRKLESLKGRARIEKLRAIYHKNEESRRIVSGHYGSLRKLALKEGIDPLVVAPQTYRDEDDVHHDLDLIEATGKPLCFTTLRKRHKRLYNVISETGWGRGRLVSLSKARV